MQMWKCDAVTWNLEVDGWIDDWSDGCTLQGVDVADVVVLPRMSISFDCGGRQY